VAEPHLRVILGSGSPRRKRLLEELGIELTIIAPDIDETPDPDEQAYRYVERLAVDKAKEAWRVHATTGGLDAGPAILIAADTIVAIDGELLGKPVDDVEAKAMLGRLAGRTHQVHTGVAVRNIEGTKASVTTTDVSFVDISDADIDWYVATGEPRDKAGAYGIHGQAGRFIDRIGGSYQNVVGLPLAALDRLLESTGTSLTKLSTQTKP